MLSRRKTDEIATEIKDFVSGYIRESAWNVSRSIPDDVMFLCCYFYYLGEYFEKAGDDINIDGGNRFLTKISYNYGWNNTAYGKTWIDSMRSQFVYWTFKIHSIGFDENYTSDTGIGIYISLVSKDNRLNEDAGNISDIPNYNFSNNRERCINVKNGARNPGVSSMNCMKYKAGDIVTIFLNLNDKQSVIGWIRNNDGPQLLCSKVERSSDIKYKIAISFWYKGTSIQLIDFKRKDQNQDVYFTHGIVIHGTSQF